MKLTTLLCILPFVAGEFLFICPNPTVEVVEGDDGFLQCRLDPSIDLTTYTVDWKRSNKVVHAYRHEQDLPAAQLDQYRGRTALNHEDLKRGVVTLQISSAQLSDSGPYRCYVPKLNAGYTVNLTVVENDPKTSDSSTSAPPVEEVTHLDDQDAAEMGADSPKVVGGIHAAAAVVVLVAAGVIFILVKRGKIRSCWRKQEEMKPNNNYEMGKLKTGTTEEDEDHHGAV